MARASGGAEFMRPVGVESLTDFPADLLRAIAHAYKIMDWHENLPEDEIPPQWMWAFDKELKVWFEEVKEARKAERDNPNRSKDTEVPMMQNELSQRR